MTVLLICISAWKTNNEAIPLQPMAARGLFCLQTFQIFFHIQVLDFTDLSALAPVQNIFPSDSSIAMFRVGALLFVNQMTILLRHNLVAVLDLKNLTGGGVRIKYHHVELTDGKL